MRIWIALCESVSPPATIEDIDAFAQHLGLNTFRAFEDDNGIELDLLIRGKAPPGAGGLVMRMLCDYADSKALPVRLYVAMYHPRLEAYYEGFGFVTDPGEDDEAFMIRYPNTRT